MEKETPGQADNPCSHGKLALKRCVYEGLALIELVKMLFSVKLGYFSDGVPNVSED